MIGPSQEAGEGAELLSPATPPASLVFLYSAHILAAYLAIAAYLLLTGII
jgi:hypothetical protein